MGCAVAREACVRGHDVQLLLGRGAAPPPPRLAAVTAIFDTAAELQSMLADRFPDTDLLIMAAAVADFIPVQDPPGTKRSRADGPWNLRLEPAPDLVAGLASQRREDQRIVGFALEPAADLRHRARAKLQRKGLDAIVANPLETMESDRITGYLLTATGDAVAAPPEMPKPAFAAWLLDHIADMAPA